MTFLDKVLGRNKSTETRRTFDPKEWPYRSPEELKDIEHLLKLAAQGSMQAVFTLASHRIIHMEWEKAAELLIVAAEKGDADAMGLLAVMYHRGLGVSKDETQGSLWFERSGGTLSLLSQYPARQFAKEVLAHKKLIEIQVNRRVYDPNDTGSWVFLGAPVGEIFFIPIDPSDIENAGSWSAPTFVRDEVSQYGGFYGQSTQCLAYFDLESYTKAKESLGRQPFNPPR
jgi:hypothetical protein